ncbi:hypothetical protein G9A89_000391 [Geosiphon pyriformis]|nr:hypothetical protein G9A89_000391 [Geosiphon pyriformis]
MLRPIKSIQWGINTNTSHIPYHNSSQVYHPPRITNVPSNGGKWIIKDPPIFRSIPNPSQPSTNKLPLPGLRNGSNKSTSQSNVICGSIPK